MSRLALENLKNLRVDIFHERDPAILEAVTNHVIADKHALICTIRAGRPDPEVKEAACEQLAEWLEMAAKERLELDSTYLKEIKSMCGKQLRVSANSSRCKERSGEALKIVLNMTAPDPKSLEDLLGHEHRWRS